MTGAAAPEAVYENTVLSVLLTMNTGTMSRMTIEDVVLRELHRAAVEAGRRGVSVPSVDLDVAARTTRDRTAAVEALRRLVRARRVLRVRRDLLVLPDATGLLGVDLVDLVDVVAPRPYLITGGRALERAGLTDQHYFGVVVLVPREVATLTYRGQTANFFATAPENIWGADPDALPCYALPERALIDVLNHPRYGVSLTQVLDALLRAVADDPGFLDRLLAAVVRYGAGSQGHGSRSAARRVGLLVERLFGPEVAAPYRGLVGESRAPLLLRPGGSPDGPVDGAWRVVVNAAIEPEVVA